MPHDLGFDDRVIGFGAGIFALGYVILDLPGTLSVERWSARRWITRIMISWGLVTMGMAFIRTPHQFYTMRFLLGLAEAGFFPGIIVYLTHWFVYEDRAKAVAGFMAAIPLAYAVGSPISGLLLGVHWGGLRGWQWLFILEGLPALFRTERFQGDSAGGSSQPAWLSCHASERLAFRPHCRTALAHRGSAVGGGGGVTGVKPGGLGDRAVSFPILNCRRQPARLFAQLLGHAVRIPL